MRSLLAFAPRIIYKDHAPVIPFYRWMVGKWRMYWNYCPECNSNTPKIHKCDVCNADTGSQYHWTKEIELTWWNKFVSKHRSTQANGHTVGLG